MPYASIDDVRHYGVDEQQASDDDVTTAIATASSIIERRCGMIAGGFETIAARTVNLETSGDTVVLPTPFRDVTAVSIDGVAVDADAYVITEWGLRFLRRGNALGPFDSWGIRIPRLTQLRSHRREIAVTATFGYDVVPYEIRRGTMLLAAGLLTQDPDAEVDPRIKTLAVEGHRVDYYEGGSIDTTGDSRVDRLIATFVPEGLCVV